MKVIGRRLPPESSQTYGLMVDVAKPAPEDPVTVAHHLINTDDVLVISVPPGVGTDHLIKEPGFIAGSSRKRDKLEQFLSDWTYPAGWNKVPNKRLARVLAS